MIDFVVVSHVRRASNMAKLGSELDQRTQAAPACSPRKRKRDDTFGDIVAELRTSPLSKPASGIEEAAPWNTEHFGIEALD